VATVPMGNRLAEQRARGIRTGVIIAVIIVVLRYLPVTSNFFLFSLIDNFAYDMALGMRASQPPSDIVIVAIDDASLLPAHLGRFPWPRDAYADLLDKLTDAKLVAFDVLFAEPDRYNPQADAAFAAAIKRHGKVVLAAHKRVAAELGADNAADQENAVTPYPLPTGGAGSLQPVQPLNLTPPLPILAAGAAGIGYVDIAPDSDGVYRRVQPLRVGYDGNIYPHFATEIARVASAATPQYIVERLPQNEFQIGNRKLPLTDGNMLINYSGPTGTIPRYSFWEVLSGKVSSDHFAGKIVLVGASAPGLYDIRPAPYRIASRFFLGVETNANAAYSILARPPLKDNSCDLLWLLFAVVIGALAGLAVWSSGEVVGPIIGLLILLLVALPSFFVILVIANQVIPYGAIVLATAIPVALGAYERLGAERKMIRSQFASYVSPDVLNMLMLDPEIVRRGTSREVTLLFSDVRGSTGLTEQSIPQEWLAQLNEYMSQMTEAIFAFDGYLDKFIGDGIMAMWNAFGMEEDDHPELAVRAGLQMFKRLELLNEYWEKADNRIPFRIGVGIHTGDVLVGDAGSVQRRQFTAIGDAVNTAARIEAMCKDLGVVFIISEITAQRVDHLFELREIGVTEVRGRSEGIRVFEVLSEKQSDTQSSTE